MDNTITGRTSSSRRGPQWIELCLQRRNMRRQIVATRKPIRRGQKRSKQVKANQKSANSPRIIINTSAEKKTLPYFSTRTAAKYKTGVMGRSFTIQSFVPSPVKFMQVQYGFIRHKERYLDSLNISDCQNKRSNGKER